MYTNVGNFSTVGNSQQRSINVFLLIQLGVRPNWVCGSLLFTRWVQPFTTVHELSNIEKKKSRQSRDSNARRLGEKRKHYLCAMPPPVNRGLREPQNSSSSKLFSRLSKKVSLLTFVSKFRSRPKISFPTTETSGRQKLPAEDFSLAFEGRRHVCSRLQFFHSFG